ncbi:acyltransferase-domain-containing protein [Xylariomycetidae sp. FL2044]|nr:acyltransferase-domain-containing protein [Xylariomycetidae sp. FL2044]
MSTETEGLRQRQAHASRKQAAAEAHSDDLVAGVIKTPPVTGTAHPAGEAKYGQFRAFIRLISLGLYFFTGCVTIHLTQFLGAPLYFVDREFYYAYMSLTKASFGLLVTTMTQWWAPTMIRVSGDASVAGQFTLTPDGRIQCDFPERMVMIANHQIYTDWLYLWWVGYTNIPQMHGHVYIILKESLKWIPLIGPGCMFFSFIFMSRKMSVDQPRLAHRLAKLKTCHTDSDDKTTYNPMWLLLFPEGTNLSNNGRRKSAKWAEKMGLKDPEHLMLPRSTGMYFCLKELKGTVDYVYDCTVAYEGVPRGQYGENFFTLSSTYFQGRPPKSVNFYWRRFALADMPLDNQEKFDLWLRERWYEKDALMEQYISTGRFPANGAGIKGIIETEVRTQYWWEFVKIFVMLGCFGLILNLMLKFLYTFRRT